jgi:hypothetical protein
VIFAETPERLERLGFAVLSDEWSVITLRSSIWAAGLRLCLLIFDPPFEDVRKFGDAERCP